MNLNDKINILWADDEIDLLKPHIMFLEQKGYKIKTANNGLSAHELVTQESFDLVFLDENMPGLSGLETLSRIKNTRPNIPVIMITKSEEEAIMEEAIGSKISDYLIKPVNPKQILLSIKKNIDHERLISKKTNLDYQQEFRKIGMELMNELNYNQWIDIFKRITYWELELEKSGDDSMLSIVEMQKNEANNQFFRFIKREYKNWLNGSGNSPIMSHNLFKDKIVEHLDENSCVYMVLIDNLRYDQWKSIEPYLANYFSIDKDEVYFSMLPTATQYSRNAIFSGLLPSEMEKLFPEFWKNDTDQGGKNMFEKEFLEAQLNRLGKGNLKFSYNKITNIDAGKKLADNMNSLSNNNLNVIVYNFVDMLSHARTDMKVIKELAENTAAYRSLTVSWFDHSPLKDMLQHIAKSNSKLILTTDHGTIQVRKPSKVLGEKDITTNLRYKQGRNMKFQSNDVFVVDSPKEIYLPAVNLSSKYIFAKEDYFFAYPNNFNYFVNHYKDTFQHGGISLEEMLIPFVVLKPKL